MGKNGILVYYTDATFFDINKALFIEEKWPRDSCKSQKNYPN